MAGTVQPTRCSSVSPIFTAAREGPLVWKSKLLSDSVWLEDFPTSLPRTNIKQVSATTTRCPWVNTSGGAETRLSLPALLCAHKCILTAANHKANDLPKTGMPERDGRQGLTKNADLQSDCEPQRTVKNCENRVVAGSGTDTLNSDHIPQAESLTQREELFQKRTSRPRMESLVLSCHTSKPDLTPNQTAVSTSPRSVTFTQSTWNFLVSRSNSPDRPLPSPKDEVILSFLVLPFSAYKSLPFYPPLWSSFLSARWEAAPFMNH
ncbi:uncharacterized protein LOC118918336 isoform X2 [Manis pentadactyla]|uniref:uncharacterized protein LOC118918336 isoform X2 n=1 Tax=Manis pentadactyla TaxID=143292 RepID=UPI00255C7E6B|nr:uncharacterized protein LOC118918336 isoform X2 [Manis pentadactyla]